MTQADTALTGERAITPTGNSVEMSRRSLLGAAVALPVIATPAVARAGESPFLAHMRESRESANAKFWRLHAEARALEDAWDEDPDDSDETWNKYSWQVREAYERALLQPVFCPAAVLAKLKIVGFDAEAYRLPDPVGRASVVIEWDLERCVKAKLTIHNA